MGGSVTTPEPPQTTTEMPHNVLEGDKVIEQVNARLDVIHITGGVTAGVVGAAALAGGAYLCYRKLFAGDSPPQQQAQPAVGPMQGPLRIQYVSPDPAASQGYSMSPVMGPPMNAWQGIQYCPPSGQASVPPQPQVRMSDLMSALQQLRRQQEAPPEEPEEEAKAKEDDPMVPTEGQLMRMTHSQMDMPGLQGLQGPQQGLGPHGRQGHQPYPVAPVTHLAGPPTNLRPLMTGQGHHTVDVDLLRPAANQEAAHAGYSQWPMIDDGRFEEIYGSLPRGRGRGRGRTDARKTKTDHGKKTLTNGIEKDDSSQSSVDVSKTEANSEAQKASTPLSNKI